MDDAVQKELMSLSNLDKVQPLLGMKGNLQMRKKDSQKKLYLLAYPLIIFNIPNRFLRIRHFF